MEERKFDSEGIISIKAISETGIRKLELHFPSDEDWIERSKRNKLVYRNLGRGIQEQVLQEPDEADAELIKRLCIGNEISVDAYEAFRILNELSAFRMGSGTVADDGIFTVSLIVLGEIETIHLMRMPTARERFQFQKFGSARTNGNLEIWSFNYDLVKDLYGKLITGNKGYAANIPVIHKLAVLQNLNAAIDRALGVGVPENF